MESFVFVIMVVPFFIAAILKVHGDGNEGHNTINLGLLTWRARNEGAVQMAIEAARRDGLLKNYTINTYHSFSSCSEATAVAGAMYMYQKLNINAIIGPLCSDVCVNLGLIVAHWDIAFLPASCNAGVLANKDAYSTLIRLGVAPNAVNEAFARMFRKNGWTRVVAVMSPGVRRSMAESALRRLRQENVQVTEYIYAPEEPKDVDIDDYLERIRGRSRVVLVMLYSSVLRTFMLRAQELGMTTDYVYLMTGFPSDSTYIPWLGWEFADNETKLAELKRATHSLKLVMVRTISNQLQLELFDKVKKINAGPPLFASNTQPNSRSLDLYQATYLYLTLVQMALDRGLDRRSGSVIFNLARNVTFKGYDADVRMDDLSDLNPLVNLCELRPGDDDRLTPYAIVDNDATIDESVFYLREPYWGPNRTEPPPDTPPCGFRGELCPADTRNRDIGLGVGISSSVVLVVALIVSLHCYRIKLMNDRTQQQIWKILPEEITMSSDVVETSKRRVRSTVSVGDDKMEARMAHVTTAIHRGRLMAVRNINKTSVELSAQDLVDLKLIKELTHENINEFMGACIKQPTMCILSAYCSKGSLQEILLDDDIRLDHMFKISLIFDLIEGMGYLHKTPLSTHGNLKSGNCLVDSRWTLKICGFAQRIFDDRAERESETTEYERYAGLLWTAPELLRLPGRAPAEGTKKADVYSFGIILQEIMFRSCPYFVDVINMEPKDVVSKVQASSIPPYRPQCKVHADYDSTNSQVLDLIDACLDEKPIDRPSFDKIKRLIAAATNSQKPNIMDNMVKLLEKYAANLEDIVNKRTHELIVEKDRADAILHSLLPERAAKQLVQGLAVVPEIHDQVTIYFSDIEGFTSLCAASSPFQVVQLLNDYYTLCDDVLSHHDVYKVETIGDAYMVASGLTGSVRHAANIADMALEMREAVSGHRVAHCPDRKLRIRIGLHTGQCASGVVGLKMPRFCLFGETVIKASLMESNGIALKIHMSEETHESLSQFAGYVTECRGQVTLKNRGDVTTYWLHGVDK